MYLIGDNMLKVLTAGVINDMVSSTTGVLNGILLVEVQRKGSKRKSVNLPGNPSIGIITSKFCLLFCEFRKITN